MFVDDDGENSEIGVQYQLRAETTQGGQVTYRVVPIGHSEDGHSPVLAGSRSYIVNSQVVTVCIYHENVQELYY